MQFDTFDEFSPWHNFVKSGAFVNFFKTGIGLSLWNLYDTHQINFFNDFRHMVSLKAISPISPSTPLLD